MSIYNDRDEAREVCDSCCHIDAPSSFIAAIVALALIVGAGTFYGGLLLWRLFA